MYLLRKSRITDLGDVNRLYGQLVDYHFRELKVVFEDNIRDSFTKVEYQIMLNSPLSSIYVLENKDTDVIGFMICYSISEKIIVENLVLDKDYRGSSLGNWFIDRIEMDHKDKDSIQLNVYDKNKPAVKFYKRNGFKVKVESNKIKTMIKYINKDVV